MIEEESELAKQINILQKTIDRLIELEKKEKEIDAIRLSFGFISDCFKKK